MLKKKHPRTHDPAFPSSQPHPNERVWYVVPPVFFFVFFSPSMLGNRAINFPSAVTNITSWVQRSCDRALPNYVQGRPLFDLDTFLVMRPNPAAGLLADVTPERFGIMLIGTVLGFNLCISIQRTPGNAKKKKKSPTAWMKLSIIMNSHQTSLCWVQMPVSVHVSVWNKQENLHG